MKLHSRIYGWKYVWMEFADEFNASVDDPNPDSSHTEMSILVPMANTTWTLEYRMLPGTKGGHDQTTVHTSYTPRGGFQFAIHPQKWLDGFKKLAGMQDIIVGHEDFDKQFVIKGNDEALVKKLFEDPAVIEILLDEPTVQLWAHCENTDSAPSSRALHKGQNQLSLRVQGAVDDFERMKAIYKLKHRILDKLVHIGVAEAK